MDDVSFKVILKVSVTENMTKDIDNINDLDEIEECDSLTSCIRVVIEYIKRNNLSQVQWDGGYVYYQNNYYGRILYDGSFYDITSEKAKLPTLIKQISHANIKKEQKLKQNEHKEK